MACGITSLNIKRACWANGFGGVCGGYVGEGLEHCGHVFSEMEEYNPAGAEERAVEMVEWIRAYWMDQARQAQEMEK